MPVAHHLDDVSGFAELAPYLNSNAQWANHVTGQDPSFFPKLAKGQSPPILWIGCADSRVPESVILARKPGEVFVHRNIANQFHPDDDSANAVLNYAVMFLGVTHVVVVGHTSCGGCLAAQDSPVPSPDSPPNTPLGRFLDPLVRLRHTLQEGSTLDELIKENVKMSVRNVLASDTIKEAWVRGKRGEMPPVYVHGWIYNLGTGLIDDLHVSEGPRFAIDPEASAATNPPSHTSQAKGIHTEKIKDHLHDHHHHTHEHEQAHGSPVVA